MHKETEIGACMMTRPDNQSAWCGDEAWGESGRVVACPTHTRGEKREDLGLVQTGDARHPSLFFFSCAHRQRFFLFGLPHAINISHLLSFFTIFQSFPGALINQSSHTLPYQLSTHPSTSSFSITIESPPHSPPPPRRASAAASASASRARSPSAKNGA